MEINCENIIEKWKKDPNFCKKNKVAVSDINNHIKLLDTLKDDYEVEQKFAIANFREGASRPLRREKDDNVKSRALAKVAERVNDGQRVTAKDAQQILKEARLELKTENNPNYEEIADNSSIEWSTGDFITQVSHLQDIDLILTDPPYGALFGKEEWDLLGQFAARVLADGGYLVFYRGQRQAVDIYTTLPKNLNHYWTFAVIHRKHSSIHHKKFYNCFKFIEIFTKGEPREHAWSRDVLDGDYTDSCKDFHEWSQPLGEAKTIIDLFCPENGTVLDPMCGAGTVPIAAYQLGRKAYGCDIDSKAIKSCKVRFAELVKTSACDSLESAAAVA